MKKILKYVWDNTSVMKYLYYKEISKVFFVS